MTPEMIAAAAGYFGDPEDLGVLADRVVHSTDPIELVRSWVLSSRGAPTLHELGIRLAR